MTRRTEIIALPPPAPGTRRELVVHRWGAPGARPKAYFQAALHADELPGTLMLDHLAARLDALDAEGAIRGEIVLVPYANPVGFDQSLGDNLIGRYRFADGGGNFNRGWPDLTPAALDELRDARLGNDAAQNVRRVREALGAAAAGLPARTEREAHEKALISLSIDADMVFDVHCDWRATMHLYSSRDYAADVTELARDLRSPVTLLDDEIDARPFDGANGSPWREIRTGLGADEAALPPSCFSVTVELRGQADVTDDLAAADAEGMLNYLMRRDVVAGDPPPAPGLLNDPVPLEAISALCAPVAGVVVWKVELGQTVAKGDTIAEVVEIGCAEVPARRHPVIAEHGGILFSMHHEPLHRPGERIGKIAGSKPVVRRPGEPLLSNR